MKEILLGILQGLTEFLPISSSGHLLFFQELLKFNIKGIGLEIAVHIATFFSIVFYFRKKIFDYYKKNLTKIILGILPAGIVGLFFKDLIENFFEKPDYLFIFFMLNGFYLLSSRVKKEGENIDNKKALIIGIMQIFSLLPGISRSGTTITTALLLGVKSREAFEFSFYMYLPLVIGAGILSFKDFNFLSPVSLSLSFLSALIFGIIALFILEGSIKRKFFPFFGIYTMILSLISFFLFR